MKKYIFLIMAMFLIIPAYSSAEDFLEIPLMPEGKIIKKTDIRLEMKVNTDNDVVIDFYRTALKDMKDIKFREWKNATYIEDDSNRPWHSITISKNGTDETSIVIMKDNWTWIISTLVIRFIGVFAVLLILYLGMSFSGGILSRLFKK
ncbi:MAG: hypothetical protein B1H11_10320 [Desulfobacteraceae bacterium 4484_190.1]|nr:MAG: hypothetical protein B1H11_10320 [Desulfobacteraceae bacterium 4484_190.1]